MVIFFRSDLATGGRGGGWWLLCLASRAAKRCYHYSILR